jgi:hypothetical protein
MNKLISLIALASLSFLSVACIEQAVNTTGSAGAAGQAQAGAAGTAGSGGDAGAGGSDAGAAGQAGSGGSDAGAGGAAGAAGEAGSGGAAGAGEQTVPEGPPGSVGAKCKDDGTCDPDLVCSTSLHCQPSLSELPSQIVQAVPPPDSVEVPSAAPILLFTDGTYANVTFKIDLFTKEGVSDVTAQISLGKIASSTGKDVFVIAPKQPYPLGASVVMELSGDITGKLTFNIATSSPGTPASLGFEGGADLESCDHDALPQGWKGFGDFAALKSTGSLVPTEGSSMLGLSSGKAFCGQAIGDTTSLVVSGPIGVGEGGVSFDYNFLSSEFDDYCNSAYDDSLIAVLSGPKGLVARLVNSVNLICATAKQTDAVFPGQPDGGDTVFRQTGNLSYNLEGDVGSPATLTFVTTDVGDKILSSLVGIDNIAIK